MAANPGASASGRWYHGWNIVAVAIICQVAAQGLPVNTFSLFLKGWSADLGTPISTLQLGAAAFGLVSSLGSPLAGIAVDRYPARWLLIAGLTGLALLHIAVSFVTSLWQLLVLFGTLLPVSVVFSAALVTNAVLARWFVKRLGLALSLSALGLGLAGAILPPIIAAVMPDYGWRAVWQVAGLIILFAIIPAVVWVVRERPSASDGDYYLTGTPDAARPNVHGVADAGADTPGWREVFRRRNFWILVCAYLPLIAVHGGTLQNLAPIAASRGMSEQMAGTLLSVFSLSHLAATFAAGMLSDRFGNRLPLFGIAMASGIGALIIAFGQGMIALGIGAILVGMAGGVWPLLASATVAEFGAAVFGRAFGLMLLFIPAIVLAPFIVARLHEAYGSYSPGLAGMALLVLLGGGGCLSMRERQLR